MKTFFQWLVGFLSKLFQGGGQVAPPVEPPPTWVTNPAPVPAPVVLPTVPAPIPTSPGTRIKGIDISHFEPEVNWAQVKASGDQFVLIKASEGETYKDDCFQKHWAGAKAIGMPRGAYHFFHVSGNPLVQIDNFKAAVGDLQTGDLPCILDIEWVDRLQQLGEEGAQKALVWLQHIEQWSGLTPWIYTNANFFLGMKDPSLFAKYPLWISAYVNHEPKLCKPWDRFLLWQYTDHEAVPGVGKIDSNYFAGSLDDLKAMAKK